MKKTYIILTLVSLFLSINLYAGRYAGDFMLIGSGAKALGMGGAYTAIAQDGSAIYWNAAGIAQIRKSQVSLMRAFLYDNQASYDNLTFCHPLPNDVTIGVNWTRLSIDDVPLYKEDHLIGTNVDQRSTIEDLQLTAIPDKNYTSTDDMFQFAFAKHVYQKLDLGWSLYELPMHFYLGGNVKYIKRQLFENTGTGSGFDLCFLFRTNLGVLVDVEGLGDISSAIKLEDVGGTKITWDVVSNHQDEILYNTRVGFALSQPIKALNSNVTIAYDKNYVYNRVAHFGIDFKYKDLLNFRFGGYENNLTTGISLNMYNMTMDYAFITNVLGSTNRIGLTLNF